MVTIVDKKPHVIILPKKGGVAQQQIIAVDFSGSMGSSDGDLTDGMSRLKYAKKQTIALAEEAQKVDPDGIDVITFEGWNVKNFWNTTPQKVEQIFRDGPGGGTPTAEAIAKAYQRHKDIRSTSTQLLIVTDGVPNDPGAVQREIVKIAREVKSADVFKIVFLTVGRLNNDTRKWLTDLDENLGRQTGGVDIVGVEPLCGASFQALDD